MRRAIAAVALLSIGCPSPVSPKAAQPADAALPDAAPVAVVAPVDTADAAVAPPPLAAAFAEVQTTVSGATGGADVGPVLASLGAGTRSCYAHGLAGDPKMKGSLLLHVSVASSAPDAANVTQTKNTGLSTGVASCVQNKVRHASFPTPSGPFAFDLQIVFAPPSEPAP